MIDLVNDPQDTKEAFQPFYGTAELSGISAPDLIHDLQTELDASRIHMGSWAGRASPRMGPLTAPWTKLFLV